MTAQRPTKARRVRLAGHKATRIMWDNPYNRHLICECGKGFAGLIRVSKIQLLDRHQKHVLDVAAAVSDPQQKAK